MSEQETLKEGVFRISGVGQSVRIYLPATAVYRGLSFIRGLVLAWLLAKQTGQYGLVSIALQAINILAPLASLGLTEAITRYVPTYQSRKQLTAFLGLACGLTVGITMIATVLMIIFSRPLGLAIFATNDLSFSQVMSLAHVTFVAILAIIVYFLTASILKGLRMFPALAYMELFHGIFYFILTILTLIYIGTEARYVIWAYVAALLVPALVWGVILSSRLPEKQEQAEPLHWKPLSRQLITFGFWASVSGIIWQAWQTYSLWHLTKFDSALHSDTFAASRLLGQLILIFGVALSAVVMTSVCNIWEKGDRTQAQFKLDLYSKLILLASLFCAVILVGLRGPLAYIFPKQLARISEILPPTFLFFQLLTVLSFLSIQFVLIEKMHLMLWSWLTGLGANVLLCLWMIVPPTALYGAAEAAVISCVPAIIVALILIRNGNQPVSRGLLLIILASAILLLPSWLAIIADILLVVWAILTNHLFTGHQRALLIDLVLKKRMG